MGVSEEELLRELLLRSEARQSAGNFMLFTTPRWKPGPIHEAICNAFDLVLSGSVDRLLLLCPPQHGKSLIASCRMPAYVLGRNPYWSVIGASAASHLSEEFGGSVRDCVASREYQLLYPQVRLSEDTAAKGRWTTSEGGGYYAAGIGSALMGRGAELGIIDDPFASWEDAQSPLSQARVWSWYTGTFYNRIRPGGAIVVIQHRMHVHDLVGRLLDAERDGGDKWHVVKMPADVSNPPWPARYDREALERIRGNTDARQWSALYMQEPVAAGGGEFKREFLEWYDGEADTVAAGTNKYILVDPASGRRKDHANDYTSMWCIGLGADRNFYVLDFIRDKLNLSERTEALFTLHRKWKPMQVRYEQYGMQADIEHLRSEMAHRNYRFSITPVGSAIDKETRIRRALPYFEAHRFWFPMTLHRTQHDGVTRELIGQFVEDEFLPFPGGRHDDAMDSLARLFEPEPEMALVWPKSLPDTPENKYRYRPKGRPSSAWTA